MRRNADLQHLAAILYKCNELNLPCEPAIRHCGECIEEMTDKVMITIQRLIDKPYNRCSRMTLVIDFENMTQTGFWTSSRIFSVLPKKQSRLLREKLETMTDMLRALYLKMKQIDIDYAANLLNRMANRCKKEHQIFDYDIWKAGHPNYTLDMLLDKEVELTTNLLISGVLAYDEMPTEEELEAVRLDKLQKHLKCNLQLPEGFEKECAKLRRYSSWEGEYLFMIDYQKIYRYLFVNCFEKFSKKQRMALYEYDMQLQMMHEDIRKMVEDGAKSNQYLVLKSEKAMKYWKRLMDLGMVDENCQLLPSTTRQQAMYIVEPFAEKLGLKRQWKAFEDFWGIKNLAQEKWKFQQIGALTPILRDIDNVFAD